MSLQGKTMTSPFCFNVFLLQSGTFKGDVYSIKSHSKNE